MVMAAGENSFAEGKIRRNIDTTFIGENALSILPIREAGLKGWRNGAIHGLECL